MKISRHLPLFLVTFLIFLVMYPGGARAAQWTPQASGTDQLLRAVAYGDGRFAAVGDTAVHSDDGYTWNWGFGGGGDVLYGTTYGDGLWVAVGYAGRIVASEDGIYWQTKQAMLPAWLGGVAYGAGKFVAVGFGGTIQASEDGSNWSWEQPGIDDSLNAITYGAGKFVAVGNNGRIISSEDGSDWTPLVSGVGSVLEGVAYGGGKFVAVGDGGTIITAGPDLAGLTVTPGSLVPAFDPGTPDYEVYLSAIESIEITATIEDPNADLTINGTPQDSGVPRAFTPAPGDNIVDITVTSGAGITRTYTITVYAAGLPKEVSVSADPGAIVADGKTKSTVTAQVLDAYGDPVPDGMPVVFSVTGGTASLTSTTVATVDGEASTEVYSTTPGPVTVTATVQGTTVSGSTVIDFIPNANLADLAVSPGILTPDFEVDTLTYEVDLWAQDSIAVTATTDDPAAGLEINGTVQDSGVPRTITLNPGDNIIDITVTSQAGTNKSYTLIVHAAGLPAEVSVAANPAKVVANGKMRSTVTAHFLDAYGSDVPDGTPVVFAVTGGTASLTSATGSTVDGVVSTEVYSNTAGPVTVTATAQGTMVSDSASMDFIIPPTQVGTEPCAAVGGALDPSEGGVIADPTGRCRLEIPAGAIKGVSGGPVRLNLYVITGREAETILQSVQAPPGIRVLGTVFDFQAETASGTPVTSFAQPIVFIVALADEDLAAVTDPERVGLFKLNDDGTLTFIGGKLAGGGLVVAMHGFSRYVPAEIDIAFTDLAGHWARDDIELLASKYVVRGLPDERFDPEGPVTRAGFTAMLVRAMGLGTMGATAEFPDVRPTDWYFDGVMTAATAGIVEGYEDGTFRPDAPVTREQVAVLMARALRASGKATVPSEEQVAAWLASFDDQDDVAPWARRWVALAVREGIVRGQNGGVFAPQAGATRAEAAVMMARYWRK